MGVRKTCNRYKTEPHGENYDDVVKRAKAFYKAGTFYISKFKSIYVTSRGNLPPFKDPDNAVYYYKDLRKGSKWIRYEKDEVTEEIRTKSW